MESEDLNQTVEGYVARQLDEIRPYKHLIHQLIEDESPETFTEFFLKRTIACDGRPFEHIHFGTYGIFDDLFDQLSIELRRKLIPVALKNALDLPDQYFHCAIQVLADLIPDDQTSPRPANFSDAFLILKKRVEKLGFLPNLSGAWDALALNQRYLIGVDDPLRKVYPNDLRLMKTSSEYFNEELENTLEDGINNCQVDVGDLEEKIKENGCDPAKRELFYVTQIEQTRYWVWDLPAKEGTFHVSTIFALRQPNNGDLHLVNWRRYQRDADRKLPAHISYELRKIEFYIHDNLQVVKRHLPTAEFGTIPTLP